MEGSSCKTSLGYTTKCKILSTCPTRMRGYEFICRQRVVEGFVFTWNEKKNGN